MGHKEEVSEIALTLLYIKDIHKRLIIVNTTVSKLARVSFYRLFTNNFTYLLTHLLTFLSSLRYTFIDRWFQQDRTSFSHFSLCL